MQDVLAIILGGGRGTRLYPLTRDRSKPAVPLAGKYRLIDIPISNCINSAATRIYVLTQYNSVSLHRHIGRTYHFDNFHRGFVSILAAQQTPGDEQWYQGTADAVRQNLRYFSDPADKDLLVLSGDQLYQMDYRHMLLTHRTSGADITIAVLPVSRQQASSLGILRLDDTGRVASFHEKPGDPAVLDGITTDQEMLRRAGIEAKGRAYLASMGIYLFKQRVLLALLQGDTHMDFGKEVFPCAIDACHVQAHLFDGYWEDIGTIGSFHQANLDLTRPDPPFDFIRRRAPVFTHPRFLAGSHILGADIRQAIIADGCRIEQATIEESVIGVRCLVGRGATIRRSVIMGADLYESEHERTNNDREGVPPVGIGEGCVIEGAIVDKNARIGSGAVITNPHGVQEGEGEWYVIRDGIVVIPRHTTVPAGAHI